MSKESKNVWIDPDIDISDIYPKITSYGRELIAEMEESEREGLLGVYLAQIDDFDVYMKLLVTDGIITHKEWDRICDKYSDKLID